MKRRPIGMERETYSKWMFEEAYLYECFKWPLHMNVPGDLSI